MKNKNKTALILIALASLLPGFAFAAPSITNVSGTVSDGQGVTVTGSGFGMGGPNTVIFDDFKKGSAGNSLTVNSAKVGTWGFVAYPGNITYLDDPDRGIVMKSVGVLPSTYGQVGLDLTPTTDFFISYWAMVPAGKDWPGQTSGEHANWKQFWMLGNTDDGHGGTANDDKIGVLLGNTPDMDTDFQYLLSGNDSPASWYWPTTNIAKGRWTRYTHWIKGATDATGQVWSQELDNTNGAFVRRNTSNVQTFNDTHIGALGVPNPDIRYEAFAIPGYYRTGGNVEVRYSDVYLATGPNAQARVEIGNAATYAASTNLALATVTSWNDTAVSATVRQGSFTNGASAYLYVFDKDGNVNANGYLVTIGSDASDTTPPAAPSGLSVQ